MKHLFRRRGVQDARLGVGFAGGGVGFARVSRRPGSPPVLEGCDFEPGQSGEALARLAGRHRLARLPVHLLVAEEDYSLLLVEAPGVPDEELRAAVRWRLRDLVDFDLEDAVIDLFDLPEHKARGRPRNLYVVAARTGAVSAKVQAARAAGLALHVVDVPELAQRNIAAELPEDATGVALLALDADSGLVTLTRRGTLFLARRLELGLDALGETPPAAAGEEPQGRTRDWLDALAVQLQRSLDFYENTYAQTPVGDLVLAPCVREVPGMADYLAMQLGVRVRELDLNELVDAATPLGLELQARCFGAIGAALRHQEPLA